MNISKKRLATIAAIRDEDIDYSDIPETDEAFWEKAELGMPQPKKGIDLHFDQSGASVSSPNQSVVMTHKTLWFYLVLYNGLRFNSSSMPFPTLRKAFGQVASTVTKFQPGRSGEARPSASTHVGRAMSSGGFERRRGRGECCVELHALQMS